MTPNLGLGANAGAPSADGRGHDRHLIFAARGADPCRTRGGGGKRWSSLFMAISSSTVDFVERHSRRPRSRRTALRASVGPHQKNSQPPIKALAPIGGGPLPHRMAVIDRPTGIAKKTGEPPLPRHAGPIPEAGRGARGWRPVSDAAGRKNMTMCWRLWMVARPRPIGPQRAHGARPI